MLPNDSKDHVLTGRVKNIMEKYALMDTPFTEEICDHIMADILAEFGEKNPAKVTIDTDTNDIEITVPDLTGKPMVFSSLRLFKRQS
jgi:hypothetical protein